ncbi:MAG TPA: cytochrome c oxidase subunit II [Gemmatimonadaceae bacterium]|nr:cytochrome c oxidase subunit II [Gemmatimonadaceae bacterium]
MSWLLSPGASTYARDIDAIYYLILVITGLAFVIVEVGLIWFLFAYRSRPGRKARYTHGNNTAEVIWTAIPAVVVVMIGIMSGSVWTHIKGHDSVPADAIPIGMEARQFEWHVTYPGADGELGTDDDFTVRNQLHIPVGRPVVLHLVADDVIHSFFVPAFRVKQDAVPGMSIPVWFEATTPGQYEIACAELCGLGHYRMRGMVTVHEPEAYEQWVREASTTVAAAR